MDSGLTCDCGAPLTTDADGHHCSACGWSWRAPHLLRSVWVLPPEEMRVSLKKRRETLAATVAPVADAPTQGGVFVCLACKSAPQRYRDFPNTWRWKTERGFQQHKCLGVKEGV